MPFSALAVAVALIHAGYLMYMVVGGFLAWRWPRTWAVHVVAVLWAVFVAAMAWPCPLTDLQNALRVSGGQERLPGTFMETYVRDVIYPAEHEPLVYLAVGVVVAVSWLRLLAGHLADKDMLRAARRR